MRIVIAGGGLVGLTTAATLSKAGHEITVLEQAPEIRAAGAGIGLWPNALRELDIIGIGDAVRGLGHEIDTWFFDPTGRPQRAPGHADTAYRFLLVPRPALNTLLADTIGRAHIKLNARLDHYTEHDKIITITLTTGEPLEADLLIGADGVHSRVRAQLIPTSAADEHVGHLAWRAIVPTTADERPEGTVLTIGPHRTRGGYARVAEGQTMWMINQFDAGTLTGTKRARALTRARHLSEAGWHDELLTMIANTPEDAILENQIRYVPPLTHWTSPHVALIGDAAHALSPHIAAGGTLGIEDAGVLRTALANASLSDALKSYESARIPRFEQVRGFSASVEAATEPADFAARYADFSEWMLETAGLNYVDSKQRYLVESQPAHTVIHTRNRKEAT